MGVPGFFAWLLKNHKKAKIILNNLPDDVKIDRLYLDANCLFHPQCFKLLDHFKNWKDKTRIENKMIKRIINYIDYLLDYANPDELFISVDGPAPAAKMNQQRKRRFRSVGDNIIRNEIKEKHNKLIGKTWNNTAITPGTEFMEKLHKAIIKYMKSRTDKLISYSSYHTAGEGEHKILDDIRERGDNNINVIYGLDADLIFLALASGVDNLYLLRESDQFNRGTVEPDEFDDPIEDVAEMLSYVDIDKMKSTLEVVFTELLEDIDIDHDNINFTDDFIVMCFLLGNDFIPHLPSVDIKTGSLDFLLKCYGEIISMIGAGLVINKKINNAFLEMLLEALAKNEKYYFEKILPRHRERVSKYKCPYTEPYQRDIWELERMKVFEVHDPIQLGVGHPDEWKFRYYEHYFGASEHQELLLNQMCSEYLESIKWTLQYYFEGCPSYTWQFNFTHAPFVSDIHKYFQKNNINMDTIKFQKEDALPPCVQLLAVLPPALSDLLPKNYVPLVTSEQSPLIHLYPTEIQLDMINKDQFWQCVPYIPDVNPKHILNAVSKIKLTKEEKTRNKVLGNFTNY